MKKHSKKFLLQFALQTIQRIEHHLYGQSYHTFRHDRMRLDAVFFRLEVLSYVLRDLHKIEKRRRLRGHIAQIAKRCGEIKQAYRSIDPPRIWVIATFELPRLKTELSGLPAQ